MLSPNFPLAEMSDSELRGILTDPEASPHRHRLAWLILAQRKGVRVLQHRLPPVGDMDTTLSPAMAQRRAVLRTAIEAARMAQRHAPTEGGAA